MPRYLDPKTDISFKKIFGYHPHLLKNFLNAILPLPEDGLIESLEYLPVEQTPVIPVLKNSLVDVKCTDQQGRIFIVEMQIQWVPNFMERMLFNTSHAYVRQLYKGENYNALHPVYGLGLLADIFDRTSDDWYHHYKIINIQKPERELKGLQLVFIELPKFKPRSVSEKKLQICWLRFLAINEETRKIEPELLEVPEIREAIELLEESAYSPGELAGYEKFWDAVSWEKTLISGKEKIAHEEGLAKGKHKGSADLLIRQLKRKFGDIPKICLLRIRLANAQQLLTWGDQVLEINNLEELFTSSLCHAI